MACTTARAVPAAGQVVCVGGIFAVVGVGVLPPAVVGVCPAGVVVGVEPVPEGDDGSREQAMSRNERVQLARMSEK